MDPANESPIEQPLRHRDLNQRMVRAQCLTALMSNPDIREWVRLESVKPGKGGALRIWANLAREYADEISRPEGWKPSE